MEEFIIELTGLNMIPDRFNMAMNMFEKALKAYFDMYTESNNTIAFEIFDNLEIRHRILSIDNPVRFCTVNLANTKPMYRIISYEKVNDKFYIVMRASIKEHFKATGHFYPRVMCDIKESFAVRVVAIDYVVDDSKEMQYE